MGCESKKVPGSPGRVTMEVSTNASMWHLITNPPYNAMMHDATTMGTMTTGQGMMMMGQGTTTTGQDSNRAGYNDGVGHNDGAGNDNETSTTAYIPMYT
jgi:hypothetical protein